MFIGVMSGTSMDAVDAAAVDFTSTPPQLLATTREHWPAALLGRIRAFAGGATMAAEDLAGLDADVGAFFAQVVNTLIRENDLVRGAIDAIGCHGQTVAHAPDASPPVTLQLGDANIVAEHTGITTINDFRRRDMAAGGQGAPLAPAFHAAVLRDPTEDRVVLNLGGIANITVLPGDPRQAVTGLDTGPANCLMDHWSKRHTAKPFDDGGTWAASGRVVEPLLDAMLDDPYFELPAPKSTGTQYFSPDWLTRHLVGLADLEPADVQATLLALTRESVADAIDRHAPRVARVLVCGGGAHNAFLLQRLAESVGRPVESTAAYGIAPDSMETMAFAWLAMRTLRAEPGNLPTVTGATGERILGAIHQA